MATDNDLKEWSEEYGRQPPCLDALVEYQTNLGTPYWTARDRALSCCGLAIAKVREKYKPEKIPTKEAFAGLIHTTAERLLIDEYRSDRRHSRHERLNELTEPIAGDSARDAIADREWLEHVRYTIDGLPDEQRRLIRLRFHEGRTYEQIAVALGCSTATAYKRVATALRVLRDRLGLLPDLPPPDGAGKE